jgi:hypothetical protein
LYASKFIEQFIFSAFVLNMPQCPQLNTKPLERHRGEGKLLSY